MFLRKPSKEVINRYLEEQKALPLTYEPIQGTYDKRIKEDFTDPEFSSYYIDHHREKLGQGWRCFQAAIKALKEWKHFELPWVELYPKNTEVEVDSVVGVLAWNLGFWSLNACRIVYVLNECDDTGDVLRYGFGYGTLPSHVEVGEERFLVEWDRATDCVYYDILSFSRHNHWLVKIGSPVGRYFQQCFASESARRMIECVRTSNFF